MTNQGMEAVDDATQSTCVAFASLPLEVKQQAARTSVLAWAMHCWPNIIRPFWHSKLIDEELVRLFSHDNDENYLMVSQPPRTGKTMMSMLFGATRYLAMNPDHNVWVVTHNQRLADKFGRQARSIFETWAPEIFGVGLHRKIRANAHWAVAGHEGSFNAIGWGGSITGNKVHLLILDDLIKDSQDAMSSTVRNQIWDWWDGTASQRIENSEFVQTKCLSIQTRWHTDDLNGRLIQQEQGGGSMRWNKLILPAIADKADVYFRGQCIMRLGDVLCEPILPLQQIQSLRRNKSRYWWETTYQQRPITQDGILWSAELFTDDLFVDRWPDRLKYLVVAVDPATGRAMKNGDYTAIVALGVDYEGQLYAEADMEKSGPLETGQRLATFCKRLPMAPDIIGVESQGFQFLVRSMAEDAFEHMGVQGQFEEYAIEDRGVPIRKEDRIAELDPLISHRDIKYVRAPGTALLVSQLKNFPSQDHDDGPDALELASWILSQY